MLRCSTQPLDSWLKAQSHFFYVRKGIQTEHSNEPLECRLSAKTGLELAGSSEETKADH
jgi:hypothetical protein